MTPLTLYRSVSANCFEIRTASVSQAMRNTLCYHACLGCETGHEWVHGILPAQLCAQPFHWPCKGGP